MSSQVLMQDSEQALFPVAGYQVYWNAAPSEYYDKNEVEASLGFNPETILKYHPSTVLSKVLTDLGFEFIVKTVEKGVKMFYVGSVGYDDNGLRIKERFIIKLKGRDLEFSGDAASKHKDLISGTFYSRLKVYDSSYLSLVLIRYLTESLGAIRLRDRGGVYFVPAKYKEALDKIVDGYSKLGYQITVLGIVEDDNIKMEVARVIESMIQELVKEIRDFKEKYENKEIKRLRKDGLETRKKRIQYLKELVEHNKELLEKTFTKYDKELNEAKQLLVELTLELHS